jgi:polysaccharide chain length determinant protein (PEP-CTERM system associated)
MAAPGTGSEPFRKLFLEHAVTIWKSRWIALGVAWFACAVAWAGVTMVPQRFESDARAFVDVNGLLGPLLKGLVVDTTPAVSEDYLRETLLSRPNLEQVIVLARLGGPAPLTNIRHEELIKELANNIKVTTDGNNLVSLGYVNRDPVVARNVVNALLTIFAEKAANSSRAEMDHARAFLNSQIGQYEIQLRNAEQRRAAFRKQYANYFTNTGVARPELLEQQVAQLQQQYDDAVATRDAIAAQLGQIPQLLSVAAAPAVTNNGQIVVASPETRLAQAKRNLADLKLSYTDQHPDVVAAKRVVAQLQADVDAQRSGQKSLEGMAEISNPAYEQLRLKLVDAQTILPALKSRLDQAEADFARAKSLSGDLPEVEAKSQDVDRDYDVIKANYDELVKRRESVNLSQAADNRSDRSRFRIIDPPSDPINPAFPNRTVLFSLATLMGLAAGIAAPLLLARIRPTFESSGRLRELGLPVVGVVTLVRGAEPTNLLGRIGGGAFAAAAASLLIVYAGLLFVTVGAGRGPW